MLRPRPPVDLLGGEPPAVGREHERRGGARDKSKLAPQLPPEPLPPARRLPVQSRSLQTVTRIVDAASLLLRSTPLDDVTTNRIAAAAADLSVIR